MWERDAASSLLLCIPLQAHRKKNSMSAMGAQPGKRWDRQHKGLLLKGFALKMNGFAGI